MKTLHLQLLLLLAILPACGDHLVEFVLPVVTGDAGASSPDGARSADASVTIADAGILPDGTTTADARPATSADAATGLDAATQADAASSPDGQGQVPPIVIATQPLDNAQNVSLTVVITAELSKAMNPTTIDSASFTVAQGLNGISGQVSYDSQTHEARFTPSAPLGLGLVYTATLTTGAEDDQGNALAEDFVWSFTTGACIQDPVDLGSAGDFAVLAGSTVTNTGPTSVTGDLGVSPGTALTGFPPGNVVGAQHAGDPAAAQATADLTTAYNDAAGRTLCPVSVAGNLGGQTLAPGLYKSTSSLEITSGNLTLDAQGDPDAVWIFQMASTLTTTSGRMVILAGNAQSGNVYWQVGSSATLGSGSVMHGTLMADQSITMNTGATLNGRALARIGAVALDSNTIVKP